MVSSKIHWQALYLKILFTLSKSAISYACEVLGITRRQITYCKKVGKGFSNYSFCLIIKGTNAYHVRIAKNIFSIDRSWEKLVMEYVGFNFVDFDLKTGNYIRAWLNGATPRLWNEVLLRSLVKSLKDLHSKPPLSGAPVFDPFFYDARKKLPKKQANVYKNLASAKFGCEKLCLCHNDVHRANLVLSKNGFLNLIDYEWSCLNNPLWELGNFIREERLSVVQIGVLLNEYGNNLQLQEIYEFIFMSACYGWLWARCMPFGWKIWKQRLRTAKDLRTTFKGLSLAF